MGVPLGSTEDGYGLACTLEKLGVGGCGIRIGRAQDFRLGGSKLHASVRYRLGSGVGSAVGLGVIWHVRLPQK
jgi:hypothetical protein